MLASVNLAEPSVKRDRAPPPTHSKRLSMPEELWRRWTRPIARLSVVWECVSADNPVYADDEFYPLVVPRQNSGSYG